MSEMQEAVQILELVMKMGGEITSVGLKLGSGLTAKSAQLFGFIYQKTLTAEKKASGKTSINKLIKKEGGELQCFRFEESQLPEVKKQLKKRGILYSLLPDLNLEDGMMEIMFHSSAAPRVNSMVEAMKFGEVIDFNEYAENAKEEEVEKLKEEVRAEMGITLKKSLDSNESRPLNSSSELENMQITNKMIVGETDIHYISRVVNKENEFLLIPKADVTDMKMDKINVSIDKNKEYVVCSNEGSVVERSMGENILGDKNIYKSGDIYSKKNDTTKKLIVNENMWLGETGSYFIINSPNKDVYFLLDKEKARKIKDGKSLDIEIDTQFNYPVCGRSGKKIGDISGEEMYKYGYELEFGTLTKDNNPEKTLSNEVEKNIDSIQSNYIVLPNVNERLIENITELEVDEPETYLIKTNEQPGHELAAVQAEHESGVKSLDELDNHTNAKLNDFKNKVNNRNSNPDIKEITINKKLWLRETDTHHLSRIPYKKNEYVLIPKKGSFLVDEGKTLATSLNLKKEYQLCNGSGEPTKKMTGKDLYDKHYDPVLRKLKNKKNKNAARPIPEKKIQ